MAADNDYILVVDDSPDGRDMLREYLTFRGFSVVDAPNGERALEVARTHPPMPGICRSIKITAGGCVRATSSARSPFGASTTENPRKVRYSRSISRPSGESSTTRM